MLNKIRHKENCCSEIYWQSDVVQQEEYLGESFVMKLGSTNTCGKVVKLKQLAKNNNGINYMIILI